MGCRLAESRAPAACLLSQLPGVGLALCSLLLCPRSRGVATGAGVALPSVGRRPEQHALPGSLLSAHLSGAFRLPSQTCHSLPSGPFILAFLLSVYSFDYINSTFACV